MANVDEDSETAQIDQFIEQLLDKQMKWFPAKGTSFFKRKLCHPCVDSE